MDASGCPVREELVGLLDERLDAADERRVSSHVAGCIACQKALDTLTADTGLDLPSGYGADAPDSSPPNPEFLDRIKFAPPSPQPPAATSVDAVEDPATGEGLFPQLPDYEILEVLGRGGEGVVYKARHRPLGRMVALKMLRDRDHAEPQSLARFRGEAETLARLRHPNIVQVYEVGEHEGRPYFALEYIEGGPLSARLQGQPQPARDAAVLLESTARAVHAAHQAGVVHRDLKPANILLAPGGAGFGAPKISDFGLAKRVQMDASLTRTGMVLGTPSYMAPEQARAEPKQIGSSCDIYALGSILYHMLTGRPPFVGARPMDVMMQVVHDEPAPPRRLFPQAPRDLETICLKCLQKDPRRRYPSADALADDLRRWLDGRPVLARPTPPWERAWKAARRRPVVAVLVAVCAVAVLLLIGGALWSNAWLTDYNHRLAGAVQDAGEKAKAAATAQKKADDGAAAAHAAEKQATDRAAEADLQRSLTLDAYQKLIFDVQATMDNRPELAAARQQILRTADRGLHQVAAAAAAAAPDLARLQAHQKLAILFNMVGDRPESQQQFQWCLQIGGDLARQGPYDERVQDVLCLTYDWLGLIASRDGRLPDATGYYRQEADQATAWLGMDPRSIVAPGLLARACEHLTIASFQMHDPKAVDSWNSRLIGAAENWVKADPKNTTARLMLMQSHGQRGQMLEEAGDEEPALEHYRRAAEAGDGLAADGPEREQALGVARMVQKSLVELLLSLGRPAEALPYAEAAAAADRKARESGAIDANDLQGQLESAESSVALAGVLQRLLRFDESVTAFKDSLAVLRPLADRARTPQDKGRIRGLIDQTNGAVAFNQAVRRTVADATLIQGQPTAIGQHLLLARVCVLMQEGRVEDAGKAADQIDRLHYDSAEEYLSLAASCAAAIGSIAPDKDAERRTPSEAAMRRRFADQSVAALNRAVALGFKDAARLKTDHDFGTVHQEPGFRDLVKRLEGGAVTTP
ncbi:MAG TPA: serine/threonine-protein kinase [Gemmataceae bacterium]|nr:serine/threonine-protein kinase [Gemmataceae bacterium]